jgi:hypothetical protein
MALDPVAPQVEHAHLGPLCHQRVDDVRADEPGAAGDQDHGGAA